ncbi:CPBP family intramembrane glutamic endopeptidase [Guptibacillus algicola]|uniref:CPBP family intramembrane glutamic endopeptidase n=1 Tax=Guptibacillus algicola TaxID=225844 RepID=UPI001CD5A568|nr:CPBP family intramembrane glutamic endopeptidase [Alkalihalobacillus algicola]MCA0987438.1 CPBP family intramembrane metalloprotease [Alkalihalobacillus algicola]
MSLQKKLQYVLFVLLYVVVDGIVVNAFSIDSTLYVYREYIYIVEFLGIAVLLLVLPEVRAHLYSLVKPTILKETSTYVWFLVSLLFLFIFREILFSIEFLYDAQFLVNYQLSNNTESFIYLFGAILLVPIYEEFIYRGLIQHWLTKKIGVIAGIVLSSILFGWIHGDYPQFGFVMGLSFGLIYHYKKSLVAAIGLHIVWNVIASL